MARHTRSSASENPQSSPAPTKKRKRQNSPDQPAVKLQRTVSPVISSVSDVSIKVDHSQKILDILQTIDTQGLLDRVFPLSGSDSTHSLRNLLENPSNHSLSQLRSVIQQLFPISFHPLSRPSQPAAKQQAFCNLALSLLDQASSHSLEFPGNLETLIPDDDQPSSSSNFHLHQKPRYALVQHIPSGDYWTSLSSDASSSELKTLPKGHSELVSILPSPYPSTSISDIPTLGSFHKGPLPPSKNKIPVAPKLAFGSFLDYGVWASFAPSFDQESAEIGRQELGQFLHAKKIQKEKQLQRWLAEETKSVSSVIEDQVKPVVDVDVQLEELFPPDQLEAIKSGLGTLELELAVSELLERNRKALRRLQELQTERLMAPGGGSSSPEEGSEEWDTAQGILDSLTALASLRPRSSIHEKSPFIPPPTVLRALHRTLPLSPSPGWYGNLPPGRTTVLRDDNTVKVKPGVPAATPAPTPTPAPPAAPAVLNPTGYGSYSYSPYTTTSAAQYRPGTTGATPYMYTPTSGASAYYSPQQPVYGQTTYTANSGAGTQAYGGTWYNNYTPQATTTPTAGTPVPMANGTGSGSGGRRTPQPSAFPSSYSSFFNNSSLAAAAAAAINGTGARTPAVANTVAKPGGQYTPMTAHASQTLTLPLHLRPQQSQNGNGILMGQQSSFYGYQPTK